MAPFFEDFEIGVMKVKRKCVLMKLWSRSVLTLCPSNRTVPYDTAAITFS